MIGAVIKTKGFSDVRRALERIERRLERPSGFLGYAGAQGHKEIMKHFREERGPKGRWEPLAASTIARRRKGKKSGGAKALQDTGRLRGSITWSKVRRSALAFMALVKYAIKHQKGTKDIPARPFLWFSDGWTGQIARKFAKYVLGRP